MIVSYALLAVAMSWPVAAHMGTRIAGRGSDVWLALWDQWWLQQVVAEGLNPLRTPYLFHPKGVDLSYHSISWLSAGSGLLFQPMLGPIAAYNLVCLLQTFLCAVTMYALSRYLVGRRDAAWIAGLVFAFAPFRMTEAGRHPNLAGTGWIPLLVLGLLKAIREQDRKWAWIAGLALGLTLLTGAHLFIMAAITVVLLLVYEGVVRRRARERAFWRQTAHFCAACLLFVLPPLLQFVGSSERIDAALEIASINPRTNLLAFVVPSDNPLIRAIFGEFFGAPVFRELRTAYLGAVPLGLSLLAAVHPATRRHVIFWGLGFAVFFVLSLGDRLLVAGKTYDVWLPYRLVEWASPIQALRTPTRFNLLLALFLAALAGYGFCVLSSIRSRWGNLRYLLAPVLLFEFFSVPFPTQPVKVSPFYRALAAEPRGALLELPMTRQAQKHSMRDQTVHGQPLVSGTVARTPRGAFTYIQRSPLLKALRGQHPKKLDCRKVPLRSQLDRLRRDGVSFVVIRSALAKRKATQAYKTYFVTKPTYRDEMIRVYDIETLLASDLPCDKDDVASGKPPRITARTVPERRTTPGR